MRHNFSYLHITDEVATKATRGLVIQGHCHWEDTKFGAFCGNYFIFLSLGLEK